MAQGFAALERKLVGLQDEFDGTEARARLGRVAKASRGDVDDAVRGDLGDLSMSGWRRGRPFDVIGMAEVVGDTEILVRPARMSRGPMRVLEQGRNMGNSGGMAGPGVSADGTTRRTKAGKLAKVRARKAKRWNGYTDGKDTWSDAERLLAERVPDRVRKEVRASLRKTFGG